MFTSLRTILLKGFFKWKQCGLTTMGFSQYCLHFNGLFMLDWGIWKKQKRLTLFYLPYFSY